ncbi:MAG: bifunctional oligoribonuclease/PAP phosphatase NrnA [Planctomycetota bacterium]
MDPILLDAAQQAFVALLQRSDHIVLTGHEHPDGDCLGAQVGLFHLLSALGKDVRILLPDAPLRTLDFLALHTPIGIFDPATGLGPCDVLMLVDCAELGRLGELRHAVGGSGATIAVLDHHIGSDQADGEYCFVDPTAAASGELVHRLYGIFERTPEPAAAEALFVALVADTGWFRYSNTDARVLEIAADLVRRGADASAIYDRLNRRNDPESVAILAQGVGRSRLLAEGRIGMIALDRGLIDRANRSGFDLDLVMEPLRSVGGIEVVAMLKELGPDRVKVSLRATGDIDVQRIARTFGGGGHRKASGATLGLALAEAEHRIAAALQAAVDNAGLARADGGSP